MPTAPARRRPRHPSLCPALPRPPGCPAGFSGLGVGDTGVVTQGPGCRWLGVGGGLKPWQPWLKPHGAWPRSHIHGDLQVRGVSGQDSEAHCHGQGHQSFFSFLMPGCDLGGPGAARGPTHPAAPSGPRTRSGPPRRHRHVALAGARAQQQASTCARNTEAPCSPLLLPVRVQRREKP